MRRHPDTFRANTEHEIEHVREDWTDRWTVQPVQALATTDAQAEREAQAQAQADAARTFDTRREALAYARTLGVRTVGDLARAHGWQAYTLDETDADADVCGVSSASYGRLDRATCDDADDDVGAYVVPDVLSGSDYSGSSVERANARAFLESFRDVLGVVDLHGGHGTYAVAVRLDIVDAEVLETLERLTDYPVVDDDTLAEVESEMDAEAWDGWARDDFRRALCARFGCNLDDVEDSIVADVFREACDASGTYFESDGADRYVDVDKVASACTLERLRELRGVVWDDDAADVQVRAERRDAEALHTRALESRTFGGGGHRLRYVDSNGRRAYGPSAKWAERHGHPAASVCECETCGRKGYVNVRPVDGAPSHGGRVFLEHCAHGGNPATTCAACGQPRDGAPGTLLPYHAPGFAGAKVGEPCPLRHDAPRSLTDTGA